MAAIRHRDRAFDDAARRTGPRIFNVTLRRPQERPKDGTSRPAGSALVSTATVLLGLLAVGLFVVSLAAQYRYVLSAKHQRCPASSRRSPSTSGMAIFSLLALGLARAGQSARVERALVVICAFGSAAMNFAAANDGSPRSVAAYVIPPCSSLSSLIGSSRLSAGTFSATRTAQPGRDSAGSRSTCCGSCWRCHRPLAACAARCSS